MKTYVNFPKITHASSRAVRSKYILIDFFLCVCVSIILHYQGNKGNPGPAGQQGEKGEGHPGPMVWFYLPVSFRMHKKDRIEFLFIFLNANA